MSKHRLVRVTEIEDYGDGEKETYEYLSTDKHWKIGSSDETGSVVLAENLTLDEVAEYCDDQAENDNRHSLVGAHIWLAAAIKKFGGEDAAIQVMRLIAEYDGLDGIDENPDAVKEVK